MIQERKDLEILFVEDASRPCPMQLPTAFSFYDGFAMYLVSATSLSASFKMKTPLSGGCLSLNMPPSSEHISLDADVHMARVGLFSTVCPLSILQLLQQVVGAVKTELPYLDAAVTIQFHS